MSATKPLFTTRIPLRWSDMDSYNHVNNTLYLRYMEEARVQLLYQMGYRLDGSGQGPVVINVSATFLRPLAYPDTVIVDCYADQAGRSSFMSYYKLYSQQHKDLLACEGSAKIVWIDTASNRSVELPDDVRMMIEQQEPLTDG